MGLCHYKKSCAKVVDPGKSFPVSPVTLGTVLDGIRNAEPDAEASKDSIRSLHPEQGSLHSQS